MVVLVLLTCSSVSFAKGAFDPSRFGLYVGAGGSQVRASATDAFLGDVDFKVAEVFAGVSWRWIGLEARQGLSLVDETVNLGTDPDTQATSFAETSIESYTSFYLRLQLYNEIARVYALLGQTEINTSSFVDNETIFEGSAGGNAYGLGAGIRVNKYIYFNVEAKRLFERDDDSFNQIGFGVEFRF